MNAILMTITFIAGVYAILWIASMMRDAQEKRASNILAMR